MRPETAAAFDAGEFRRALGSFLTGVTIVTTVSAEGEPRGFTANSFTSVSLDPPLVLVCIAKKALGHSAFSTSRGFAINILSESQKAESGIFASKAADKFASVAWQSGQTGNPLIDGSVAVFDCGMEQLVDAGDHSILIGRVRDFTHNGAQPLGYCRGTYVTPASARRRWRQHLMGPKLVPFSRMKAACCSSKHRAVSTNCRRVAGWARRRTLAASRDASPPRLSTHSSASCLRCGTTRPIRRAHTSTTGERLPHPIPAIARRGLSRSTISPI
ncbi:flavin reductase family protein [Mesorhizobium sp. M0830]